MNFLLTEIEGIKESIMRKIRNNHYPEDQLENVAEHLLELIADISNLEVPASNRCNLESNDELLSTIVTGLNRTDQFLYK